jgi:uncharacterized membrane protein
MTGYKIRALVMGAASVAGVAIMLYLTVLHYLDSIPVCPASGIINCEKVLTSQYSVVPGTSIPISVPGMFWFIVMGIIALSQLTRPSTFVLQTGLIWSIIGIATVFYLLNVELNLLNMSICIWCTAAHFLIVMCLLLSVAQITARTEKVEEND